MTTTPYRTPSPTGGTTEYKENPTTWDYLKHWRTDCTYGPKRFYNGGNLLIHRCTQCGAYHWTSFTDYDWECLVAFQWYKQARGGEVPDDYEEARRGQELDAEITAFNAWAATVPQWDPHPFTIFRKQLSAYVKTALPEFKLPWSRRAHGQLTDGKDE